MAARTALLPETANYINVCKNVEFHLQVGTILKNKALKTLNNVIFLGYRTYSLLHNPINAFHVQTTVMLHH